ncbi:hypothetical protein HDV05_006689, partial [Chytridiales sp. JEL 0842]
SKTSPPLPKSGLLFELAPDAFTLDPHQLSYILQRFNSSNIVSLYRSGNIEQLETALLELKAAEASTQPAPTATATSGGYLGYFWGSTSTTSASQVHIEEELLNVFKFFEKVSTLRIAPAKDAKGIIKLNELGSDSPSIELGVFKSLTSFELVSVHPSSIKDWFKLKETLECVLIRDESLHELDGSELPESFGIDETASFDERLPSSLSGTQKKARRRKSVYSTHLKRLSFVGNCLKELSTNGARLFASATTLDLSSNAFESLPSSLLEMKYLEHLNLAQNKLIDLIPLPPPAHPFTLKHLTWLSLRKNNIEVLQGLELFEALKYLDLADNNISEVFEIGRLSLLESLSELHVAGNPFAKTEHFRANIFTYFKQRALELALDGQLPSAAEKKQILAGLTIAAVVTTSNPGKVTVSTTVHKVKARPSEPLTAAEETVKHGGKKKKKGKKDGEKRRRSSAAAVATETEASADILGALAMEATVPEVADENLNDLDIERPTLDGAKLLVAKADEVEESVLHLNIEDSTLDAAPSMNQLSEDPNFETPVQETATATPVPIPQTHTAQMVDVAPPSSFGKSLTEGSFVDAHQELPVSESFDASNATKNTETFPEFNNVDIILPKVETALSSSVSTKSSLSEALSKVDRSVAEEPPPMQDPPLPLETTSIPALVSQTPPRSRIGILAQLAEKKGDVASEDAESLLLSRTGRNGFKIKEPTTPNKRSSMHSENIRDAPSLSSSPKHTSLSSSLPRTIPVVSRDRIKGDSPVASPSRGNSPAMSPPSRIMSPSGFTIKDLKGDKGEAWLKKVQELQAKEKRVRDAQIAADLAAAKAKEAAHFAVKLAEEEARGDGESSSVFVVAASSIPETSKLLSLSPNSKPGHLDAIGPYRRVYDYEQKPVRRTSSPGANGRALSNNVVVSFGDVVTSSSNTTRLSSSLQRKSLSLGPDVELGTSGEFRGIQPKSGRTMTIAGSSSSLESLPPLFVRPTAGLSSTSNVAISYVHKSAQQVNVDHSTAADQQMEQKVEVAAKLVLSRPIATAGSYRRPKDGSVSSKSDNHSVYSGIYPTHASQNRTLMGKAVSLFSGDGGMSVFTGIPVTASRAGGSVYGRQSIISTSLPHSWDKLDQLGPWVAPRAPTIPYMTMNNSLQLFLKFRVFPRDTEKIQAWVPCSVVGQLPMYAQDIPGASSSSTSKLGKVIDSIKGKASVSLERLRPIERAAYILLTDRALYFFTPVFKMPHNPFESIRGNLSSAPAVSSHLSDVISQVR